MKKRIHSNSKPLRLHWLSYAFWLDLAIICRSHPYACLVSEQTHPCLTGCPDLCKPHTKSKMTQETSQFAVFLEWMRLAKDISHAEIKPDCLDYFISNPLSTMTKKRLVSPAGECMNEPMRLKSERYE